MMSFLHLLKMWTFTLYCDILVVTDIKPKGSDDERN